MTTPVYRWQPTSLDIAEKLGIPIGDVVRFDQNTSPLRPGWANSIASSALARINEYPFADYRTLREAAAERCNVSADWVVAGAGADELIGLCASAFLPFRGTAATAPPTYGLYGIASAQREAQLQAVPRLEDFALDVPAMVEAAQQADLVWLCVPNNPTGNRDTSESIEEIVAAAKGVVVLDAAYAEFAGDQWADQIERFPNLVVLRTLSKAFSLAGIRVGYAIAQPHRISELDRRRPPGSVSAVSATLAEYALRNPRLASQSVELVARERTRLASKLSAMGLGIYPSSTNFILTRIGSNAESVAEELMWNHGMVLRTFPTEPRLVDHVRITVRSPSENDRLLALLKGTLT